MLGRKTIKCFPSATDQLKRPDSKYLFAVTTVKLFFPGFEDEPERVVRTKQVPTYIVPAQPFFSWGRGGKTFNILFLA